MVDRNPSFRVNILRSIQQCFPDSGLKAFLCIHVDVLPRNSGSMVERLFLRDR